MLEPGILRPATDAVLQTAPPAALSAGAAARVHRKGPSRLVARMAVQKSSVSRSSSRGGIGSTPAEGIDGVAHHFLGAPRLRDVARRADHRKALRAQSLDRRRAARIVRQVV